MALPPVRRSLLPVVLICGTVGLLVGGGASTIFEAVGTPIPSPTAPLPTPAPTSSAEPRYMVGAGDIGTCDSAADSLTAELVAGVPGVVFTLGDNAPIGRRRDYRRCYAETWGVELGRTRPAVGDEDYVTDHGAAYFDYFGTRAGPEGYYSYDVGRWHVVVLNSECHEVGGCDRDSPQGRWLAADLAANPSPCTLAMWHRPLLSAQGTPDAEAVRPFWETLYAAGAELVLNAHFHAYQRFAPMTPQLAVDPAHGMRQIIVGTGGDQPMLITERAPNVEREGRVHGVLVLKLYPDRYEWEFAPIRGERFTDSGGEACHDPPAA